MALPVAVQLYSIRDDVKADMKGTLKKVKDMQALSSQDFSTMLPQTSRLGVKRSALPPSPLTFRSTSLWQILRVQLQSTTRSA